MAILVKISLCLIIVVGFSGGFNRMPWYLKACSRSDPKFNECALKSGQNAMKYITAGDAEYHIPKMNPLKLDYIGLETSDNIKLYANDLTVTGLDQVQLRELNWDFDQKIVTLRVFTPIVNIVGTYNMDGKILIMNLKGSGPMNNSYYDNDILITAIYSLYKRNDIEYTKLDKTDVSLKILKGVNLQFGNLLNNTKLSQQMNEFLNENWRLLLQDLYPSVNKVISTLTSSIINPIAAKIPYNTAVLP